ncbi:TadE/TadG family type IV pilus assembly protein [Maritalea porphyrae]|uniref:Flp pilus-assembly TadG-like N-terminal domain-containing protein n=1 Tax=Maritalea porphyrae TaxID=880732 RepID=A0ABQ5UR98_9HYPH|nr:pilus assembly protein [Maritalea porphyrae]GLQ17713.1 hypothetical protein GCM10007879_19620 [Maritalea porphyrae]
MKFILSRLKSFGRDEGGAFAVIFGVIAVVLIATGGSAVDFVNIQQARKTTQISLDSTVLSLQPEIYKKNKTWIKNRAQKLATEAMNGTDISIAIDKVEIDTEAGRLMISAKISRPTLFVRLVGVNEMKATLVSEATRAKNRLEVVMVLDNSGSMASYGRITALKTASTLAVDILSGGDAEPDKVFIGIVPFTMAVNVGEKNKTAKWLDTKGVSSISWDNLDDDDNSSTGHDTSNPSDRMKRIQLYASIPNVSWKGCVEARPHDKSKPVSQRLDVNDEEPNMGDPDTYFVPMFNPDQADTSGGSKRGYMQDTKGSCGNKGGGLPWLERHERECKYRGQKASPSTGINSPNGPCGDAEILPLTNKMSTIKTAINAMVASGGTNIHQGAIWGWRVLSPTAPYDEGVPYDDGASKVMILMTDGQNYASQTKSNNYGSHYYSAYGWPINERLGKWGWSNWQVIKEMDNRTKWACENAKSSPSKIEIYTIGLGISASSTNGKMLSDCATSSNHDFFPSSSSDLIDTFETIADQLSDLRLSK